VLKQDKKLKSRKAPSAEITSVLVPKLVSLAGAAELLKVTLAGK
jgi:hypothetical protein